MNHLEAEPTTTNLTMSSMIQNARIQTFVQLINDRFLNGKASDQLMALWKEATHYETCTTVVQKSKNADRLKLLDGWAFYKTYPDQV